MHLRKKISCVQPILKSRQRTQTNLFVCGLVFHHSMQMPIGASFGISVVYTIIKILAHALFFSLWPIKKHTQHDYIISTYTIFFFTKGS
jgi:hypothetical protein